MTKANNGVADIEQMLDQKFPGWKGPWSWFGRQMWVCITAAGDGGGDGYGITVDIRDGMVVASAAGDTPARQALETAADRAGIPVSRRGPDYSSDYTATITLLARRTA